MATFMSLLSRGEVVPQDGALATHRRLNSIPIRGHYRTPGSLIPFARSQGPVIYLLWLHIWSTIVSANSVRGVFIHALLVFLCDLIRSLLTKVQGKSVFVPMTFPSELNGQESREVELMVRSSFSDPGSFFGLMTMCAAHRAALSVNRGDASTARVKMIVNDPDFCIMKAKSIREMNAKMQDPQRALSDEAFDTIVNLLTGSVYVLP